MSDLVLKSMLVLAENSTRTLSERKRIITIYRGSYTVNAYREIVDIMRSCVNCVLAVCPPGTCWIRSRVLSVKALRARITTRSRTPYLRDHHVAQRNDPILSFTNYELQEILANAYQSLI